MGWARGADLADKLIATIQRNVPDNDVRMKIYVDLIEAFEDADWDTIDESMENDPVFDAAVKQLHPDWFEEDD